MDFVLLVISGGVTGASVAYE